MHPLAKPLNRIARRGRRGSAGFTLIELMVAMIVSAIVILGIFAFSTIQQSTANLHERNVRIQQALEGAVWSIAQDVRSAGLGFARSCTELRVFDAAGNQLINPGGGLGPAGAVTDAFTGEAYWVLRDGLQAHWNSSAGASLNGTQASSATPDSAADSFDVITAEPSYLNSFGVFILEASIVDTDIVLTVRTSNLLRNDDVDHLAQVQQLFPPGSFVTVGRVAAGGTNPFRPESQGQCLLLQITGDVTAAPGGDLQLWQLPIDGAISDFNAGLALMLADNDTAPTCPAENPGCDDWDPAGADNQGGGSAGVLPLGRLRWSRYEIDYTIERLPYLVRYDIIGHQPGVDPENLGAVEYPHCGIGECTAAQLHLPGPNAASPPVAIAIGPMIEDMQVAVGCDGYTVAGAANPVIAMPPPDAGFEEMGPQAVPVGPNNNVDENAFDNLRDSDEWLGNAASELWAPDCVWYGTAEYDAADWVTIEGDSSPPPAFRMSPQTIRVTLVGSSEFDEQSGGLATTQVLAVEDRAPMDSLVGARQRFTVTEYFTPKNARWRDPTAQ